MGVLDRHGATLINHKSNALAAELEFPPANWLAGVTLLVSSKFN